MSPKSAVILSLETSTATGSVALVAGEQILLNESFSAERTHNAKLFGPVQRALALAAPDLIVVGTGPGSYTGVRVSLAAAIGLSLVRPVPVIGLSSLLAAESGEAKVYQIVGDARRGQFFTALVSDGRFLSEPQLTTWEALCADWHENPRPDWRRMTFDEKYPPGAELQLSQPTAKKLALLAQRLTADEISALSQKTPEPYYLSAPFITEAKKAR